MGSDEVGRESRTIYNLILATVTTLGLLSAYLTHHGSPLPPTVTLRSLSANYTIKPSKSYPGKIKYSETTFLVNISVHNPERQRQAVLEYVDVWVNARAGAFQRIKLGQRLILDQFVLGPGERKELELAVSQDRPIRVTEWPRLLVSVFVRARFPGTTDLLGNMRMAHKTRNCANLNATLHNDTNTAVVDKNEFPRLCGDPY